MNCYKISLSSWYVLDLVQWMHPPWRRIQTGGWLGLLLRFWQSKSSENILQDILLLRLGDDNLHGSFLGTLSVSIGRGCFQDRILWRHWRPITAVVKFFVDQFMLPVLPDCKFLNKDI